MVASMSRIRSPRSSGSAGSSRRARIAAAPSSPNPCRSHSRSASSIAIGSDSAAFAACAIFMVNHVFTGWNVCVRPTRLTRCASRRPLVAAMMMSATSCAAALGSAVEPSAAKNTEPAVEGCVMA